MLVGLGYLDGLTNGVTGFLLEESREKFAFNGWVIQLDTLNVTVLVCQSAGGSGVISSRCHDE
jgi:hypothetical protein